MIRPGLLITVLGVDDAPVAVNDVGSGLEDSDIVLSILLNDYDLDGTLG